MTVLCLLTNSTSTATCPGRRENPWRSGRPGLFEPLQCHIAQHHDFRNVSMYQLLRVHASARLSSATVRRHCKSVLCFMIVEVSALFS